MFSEYHWVPGLVALRYLNGDVFMNLKVIEGLYRFPVSKTR